MVELGFRDIYEKLLQLLKDNADKFGLKPERIIDGAPNGTKSMTAPCISIFAAPNENEYEYKAIGIMDIAIFITNKPDSELRGTVSNTVEMTDKVYLFLNRNFPQPKISTPQVLNLNGNSTILYIEIQAPYRRATYE